jgi:hypothetical protein
VLQRGVYLVTLNPITCHIALLNSTILTGTPSEEYILKMGCESYEHQYMSPEDTIRERLSQSPATRSLKAESRVVDGGTSEYAYNRLRLVSLLYAYIMHPHSEWRSLMPALRMNTKPFTILVAFQVYLCKPQIKTRKIDR